MKSVYDMGRREGISPILELWEGLAPKVSV